MTEGMTLILLKNLILFWNPNRSRIPGMSPVPEWKEIETKAMVTMRMVTMKITLGAAVLTAWGPRGNGTATEIPAVPGGAETPAGVEAPREAVEARREEDRK